MKQKTKAVRLYYSQKPIYKNWDYRCLVPDSDKDPEKWRSYDMPAYRGASTKKDMGQVKTYKYEKSFNNWIDGKVLKEFVNDPTKAWKLNYGFPFVAPVPRKTYITQHMEGDLTQATDHALFKIERWITEVYTVKNIDSLKCHMHCAKLVSYCFSCAFRIYLFNDLIF